MSAKNFRGVVRKMVREQMFLLRDVDDPMKLSEIITSLMGHNAPTFRQWRTVLWLLFKKKFNDRSGVLYTIYELAGIKAKEEERRISSKKKREEFQKQVQDFSNWFWDQYKHPLP